MTLISLDEGAKLSGLQRIVENDANETTESTDDAAGGADPDAGGATGAAGDSTPDVKE